MTDKPKSAILSAHVVEIGWNEREAQAPCGCRVWRETTGTREILKMRACDAAFATKLYAPPADAPTNERIRRMEQSLELALSKTVSDHDLRERIYREFYKNLAG